MQDLPVNNTCTYEGPEYECVRDSILPYMNDEIAAENAAFIAHAGDIMSESLTRNFRILFRSLSHILLNVRRGLWGWK